MASGVSDGSPSFSLIRSYSSISPKTADAPSRTTASTVRVSFRRGSCSRKPTRYPGDISTLPSNFVSAPARIRSSVDLPAPFRPSTPIFAP